jgi:hypothetical protein
MGDEAENRSAEKADSGDAKGERDHEHSPLQTRAAFIQNWDWKFIISLNGAACERGRAQHGINKETHEKVRTEWEEARAEELTLLETLDFLRHCHRSAPFLFFNGNTFAELARRLVDVLFADLPRGRRREADSLAAHYVAGVLDQQSMMSGIDALAESADFQPGDRVKTLKGSLQGVVRKILSDGRIVWQPDDNKIELTALPESLLRLRRRSRG